MGTDRFIALCFAALAAQCAVADGRAAPAAPPANVTVNLGALPVPVPRHKPTQEQMKALLVPMPRPKPTLASLATLVPMPRPKPAIAVAEATHKDKPQEVGTEAAPAHAGPMTSPQSAAAVAAELRGTTSPGAAPAQPVNPVAGFSVLTRVRFRNGQSDLGNEAKASLDTLAARLLANEERVRLAAFSGQAGDTSSEARRLSLERALAVRTYLVSKGVPISRVDVLAFGGSTDGTPDRVDVMVRAI